MTMMMAILTESPQYNTVQWSVKDKKVAGTITCKYPTSDLGTTNTFARGWDQHSIGGLCSRHIMTLWE